MKGNRCWRIIQSILNRYNHTAFSYVDKKASISSDCLLDNAMSGVRMPSILRRSSWNWVISMQAEILADLAVFSTATRTSIVASNSALNAKMASNRSSVSDSDDFDFESRGFIFIIKSRHTAIWGNSLSNRTAERLAALSLSFRSWSWSGSSFGFPKITTSTKSRRLLRSLIADRDAMLLVRRLPQWVVNSRRKSAPELIEMMLQMELYVWDVRVELFELCGVDLKLPVGSFVLAGAWHLGDTCESFKRSSSISITPNFHTVLELNPAFFRWSLHCNSRRT